MTVLMPTEYRVTGPGNRSGGCDRQKGMRTSKALVAALVSIALLAAACGDEAVDTGTGIGRAPDGSGVTVPDRAADLVGTITTVTPFEPVTEGCTPAEDLDPNQSASSDDPPVCTPDDNTVIGSITVEEQPDDPQGGRKIAFTVTTDTKITGTNAAGLGVGVFADFVEGQTVDTWVLEGVCAESYPEQCGLEAIRVTR